jgi:alcohol dehydrogenase/propanol-preferring alcohol dehydrogenase
MATTMRVAQVGRPKGPFEIVERPMPTPGPGTVRIAVQACGICHSDVLTKQGGFPGLVYPRVPGHEVAGVIDAIGPDVDTWKVGERVGVGWNGGYCGKCDPCRRGDLFACVTQQVTGITFDGGYGTHMIAPISAVARMPADLSPIEAAPLMCAGVTTFNALRNSGARPGDVVAVLGIGGLGHLGIQFAARMGYHTVAVGRGADKAQLAKDLGAAVYLDTKTDDAAAELQKLGGRRCDPRHRDQWRCDERHAGRPRPQRHTARDRRRRFRVDHADHFHLGQPLAQGLVLRHLDRLAGRADLQRPPEGALDERDVPARARGRSVRPAC